MPIYRILLVVLLSPLLALAPSLAFAAEPRVALVIGNSHYAQSPLTNPANDASDVAGALRKVGFDVALKLDVDRQTMLTAIREFGSALERNKGVGFFFYAGHGLQVSGQNYLLPVGDLPDGEDQLKTSAVNASQVVDAMASAGNALNIVVLDACRNNQLGRSGTSGLSRIDSNARLFVSFSTSPGEVALDGSGRNSPFTKHLAEALAASDLSLEETFKKTLKGVYVETQGQQVPWISSSYFGEFVFRPRAEPAVLSLPQAKRPAAARFPWLTGVYHADGINPNGSRYQGMVAVTQKGDGADVSWWIGKQYFHGTGHFAGRMLVVNWGEKHPVIYTFGANGSLDGEWADGQATERLEAFSAGAEAAAGLAEGRYAATGRNPNGSSYRGTVDVSRRGGSYHLLWRIGSSSYEGDGTLDGGILTVNWGGGTPVVYALSADGGLKGLWEGGKGEETLSPQR